MAIPSKLQKTAIRILGVLSIGAIGSTKRKKEEYLIGCKENEQTKITFSYMSMTAVVFGSRCQH